VQSFVEAEVRAVGRSQKTSEVRQALETIRQAEIPKLNLDLIYGMPHQTLQSWRFSINAALEFEPEEIYLYPLYVRPLTGLNKRSLNWDDSRLRLYREGRDILLSKGYEQISMRIFRKTQEEETTYTYQNSMVGLGCGARSYTSTLHYSSEYAVAATGVKGILADYIARADNSFDYASHGFALNLDEQKRRFVVKSLLQIEGLSQGIDCKLYKQKFNAATRRTRTCKENESHF